MRDVTIDDVRSDRLRFVEHGEAPPMIPVVAQDAATGAVLMVAWADREALERSLTTGSMHYFSRSRGRLWLKGEESGHVQRLISLWTDCDADSLVAVVEQTGPACHTGGATCFHDGPAEARRAGGILGELGALVAARARDPPSGSHTARLLADENLRLKKLIEEAGELQVALARDEKKQVPEEAADLLYHMLVALHAGGVTIEDVLNTLRSRRG
jgi:phosphoribosyl-AMP cyclohydrolase / phosphoribosyl-ATP pyrophosphohydrolase